MLHAGRHLRAEHVPNFVHLKGFKDFLKSAVEGVFGHPVQATEILHHLPGGHAVVDPRVARHEADAGADEFGIGEDICACDDGFSSGGAKDGAEDPQTSRLAGPVGAEQAEDFSGPDLETDVIESRDVPAAQVGERFGQMADLDHRPLTVCRRRSAGEDRSISRMRR